MDGYYNGKDNEYDTILDDKQQGIQIWNVPKNGLWKIICYGAKGGDSTYKPLLFGKNKHLSGGYGACVGGIIKLYENDKIKIVCGQMGIDDDGTYNVGGGGGGGATYFILYKSGNNNPKYKNNTILNIPLIIASGGNGACGAYDYKVNGINGLCSSSENRNDFGGYKSNGRAARGASFKNDFNTFKSYIDDGWKHHDYNKCNGMSFLDGSIGGKGYDDDCCDGGFGGGGGSYTSGGAGGGYIGGLVSPPDPNNSDSNKYSLYGGLSYNICQNNKEKIITSANNNGHGKITVEFVE